MEPINLYSAPSFAALTADRFEPGDKAYATTSNPTLEWENTGVGTNFVEVAIYEGNIAWVPLRTADGRKILEEYPTEDCSNPGPGAAGYATGGGTPFCFYVQTDIGVYDSPSFSANRVAGYVNNDVAYATDSEPTREWVDDGTADGNNFYKVAIFEGNIGWVPRSPEGSDFAALKDYSGIDNCPNPGPGAASAL